MVMVMIVWFLAIFCIISFFLDKSASLFVMYIKNSILDALLKFVTNFAFVAFIVLAVPIYFLYKKRKRDVGLLVFTFIATIVINIVAKFLIHRERPIGNIDYINYTLQYYSFPSTHTVVVFSMLPLLIKFLPKQRHFWIFFAILIGFTRVYLNYHFLSDVAFGALFGFLIGNFVLFLEERGKLWKK